MMVISRVCHSHRIQDVRLEYILIALTCDLFDNGTQKKISGIVVDIFGARLELQVAAAVCLHKFFNRVWIATYFVKEIR